MFQMIVKFIRRDEVIIEICVSSFQIVIMGEGSEETVEEQAGHAIEDVGMRKGESGSA